MNTIYNASAGTGKTYQITQYYEKLVIEKGVDPRDILLMTFSDNAGTELRQRVTQRLQEIREIGSDEEIEVAIHALHALSSSFIGTIHAFCARLLREHALEIGLAPNFSTLIEDDYADLIQQIARRNLLDHLENDADFRVFCSGAQPFSFGSGFGTSIIETVAELIAQAGSLGIDLESAVELLPLPDSLPSRIDFEHIYLRLQEHPNKTPKVSVALKQVEDALANTSTIEELIKCLAPVKMRKAGKIKELVAEFMDLKIAAEEALRYRKAFPAAKAFARYLQTTAQAFHQAKRVNNTVDFNDQLQMALHLLQTRPPPPFKYIIVDEVQDTSRIQYKIIQALWKKEAQLIICGDKKQSIYTWRGADPDVMPDLEKAILAVRGTSEPLQTSYRTKSQILDLINPLFKSVYTPEIYTETQHLQSNFQTPEEKPCVEFLDSDLDPDLPKRDRINAEMAAVANRIQQLVNGATTFQPAYRYDGETFTKVSDKNAYRYSDVLILLRRTTHQSVLEQALRHAQIPYTLGGKGRGFFGRTEVRDVALFLSTITNPNDLFSLIGFLRSPWVGISDEEIAQWSKAEDFNAKNLLCFIEKAEHPVAKLIHKYRGLLATHLVSELVRLLIEESYFDALLAAQPRGAQCLANLQKMLDWLRKTERGSRITPAQVARRLADKIKNPPPVPEAALPDPSQNVVTIMTVHGSKGLSRRVVFIPDISSSVNANRSFAHLFSPHNGIPSLALKITQPDKSSAQSPNLTAAQKYAKKMREHEFKNLLYVATTRARDLLIFSATSGAKPKGWLAYIQPFIEQSAIISRPYSDLEFKKPASSTRFIPTSLYLEKALEGLPKTFSSPALQRLPATRVAQSEESFMFHTKQDSDMTPRLGSLGHAVLEQLAYNNWVGDVSKWLEKLRSDFSIAKSDARVLIERIERAQQWMQNETANATFYPERPFVLHHENQLIDGTIDLLSLKKEQINIYDYKFTHQPDDVLRQMYQKQMQIYAQAAQHFYPNTPLGKTLLVVITKKDLRTISL